MEAPDGLSQQERLQVLAESRKRQTEMENKRRQLEQDRRQLQHIKSKALRERWLLEGAPPAGSEEHNAVRKQLEEDENQSHELENSISRLEEEVMCLESGSTRPYVTMTRHSVKEVEVHSQTHVDQPDVTQPLSDGTLQSSDGMLQSSDQRKPSSDWRLQSSDQTDSLASSSAPPDSLLKAAMYSVEIKVERDKVTGETKVLSTNTLLPVDLSLHGVKVYEDRTKVVHEVNGENDVQPLSFLEVEDLILKADQVSMETHPAEAPTHHPASPAPTLHPSSGIHEVPQKVSQKSIQEAPQESIQEAPQKATQKAPQKATQKTSQKAHQKTPKRDTQKTHQKAPQKDPEAAVEGRGPELDPGLGIAEASEEKPVTMVFMGYQSVEDQDHTSRVLGLEGTVNAELVLIEDNEGKTPSVSPVPAVSPGWASMQGPTVQGPPSVQGPSMKGPSMQGPSSVQAGEPNGSSLPSSLPLAKAAEKAPGGAEGGATEVHNQEKEEKPCRCCIVM